MKIKNASFIAVTAFAACTLMVAGCGKKPSAQKETAPAPTEGAAKPEGAAPAAAAQGTGTIKGSVKFTGTAPEMPELNRQSDPFCAQTAMKAEEVIVNSNSTLKNVAIRVLGASGPKTSGAKVVIDQKECMYRPRVATAVSEESIVIENADPTLHNVHTYAGSTTLFNRAQPKGSPAIDHQFKMSEGEIIKFKCDVHPWMTGWLILNESALNAVTGDTGEFEIKDVPAGTYKLKTFHEQYGEKEIEVTVKANETANAEFSYDGTEKAAYNYREIMLSLANHDHQH